MKKPNFKNLISYCLLLIPLFTLSSAVFSFNCFIPSKEEQQLLTMSYQDFDQSNIGWRRYAKLNCYHEVAELIDKYFDKNKHSLAEWQSIALTWHAGQLYAFNNEYEIAKLRFEHSLNQNELPNTVILWNDYVYATIAFLDHDRIKLQFHRDNIAEGPIFNGKKQNLDVVDRLIKYFGYSYSFAYGLSK